MEPITPQASFLVLCITRGLIFLAGYFILYLIYNFFTEGRDGSEKEEAMAQTINSMYGGAIVEYINEGAVDSIWKMDGSENPKAKGDALEKLTVKIFKGLDYNAWTTSELKAMGANAPYDLTKLTGFDQGADVIAEKKWWEQIKRQDGVVEQFERTERILIQCKAYLKFDEESSNSTIQATIASRTYYESLCGVKFDKVMVISTAQSLTVPAMDLARHGKIDICLQDKLKQLVSQANYNIRRKAQLAEVDKLDRVQSPMF